MKTKRPSYPDGPYCCHKCEYRSEPCKQCKLDWADYTAAFANSIESRQRDQAFDEMGAA